MHKKLIFIPEAHAANIISVMLRFGIDICPKNTDATSFSKGGFNVTEETIIEYINYFDKYIDIVSLFDIHPSIPYTKEVLEEKLKDYYADNKIVCIDKSLYNDAITYNDIVPIQHSLDKYDLEKGVDNLSNAAFINLIYDIFFSMKEIQRCAVDYARVLLAIGEKSKTEILEEIKTQMFAIGVEL